MYVCISRVFGSSTHRSTMQRISGGARAPYTINIICIYCIIITCICIRFFYLLFMHTYIHTHTHTYIHNVDVLFTHVHTYIHTSCLYIIHTRTYIHTYTQINEAMYLPEMNGQPMIVINVPDKGKADNIIGKCMLVC
jgi:hypothetical protein